jgi:hypothetical protein
MTGRERKGASEGEKEIKIMVVYVMPKWPSFYVYVMINSGNCVKFKNIILFVNYIKLSL